MASRESQLEAALLNAQTSLRAVAVHSVQASMRADARQQVDAIDALLSGKPVSSGSPDQLTE